MEIAKQTSSSAAACPAQLVPELRERIKSQIFFGRQDSEERVVNDIDEAFFNLKGFARVLLKMAMEEKYGIATV